MNDRRSCSSIFPDTYGCNLLGFIVEEEDMIDRENRWVGEDSWADEHMNFRGWYIAIGLGCLTWVAIFVLGIIVGRLFW